MSRVPWVDAAQQEDRRGEGWRPRGRLYARLMNTLPSGRPLPPLLKTTLEARFGRDLQFVRVHMGKHADTLTVELGCKAFCFRNHVYLGCGLRRDILEHEIAHLLIDSDSPMIRSWNKPEHYKLTMNAARKYFRNSQMLEMLSAAANKMDYRERRLRKAAAPYLIGKVTCQAFPPEGVEHGEGGMYDLRVAKDMAKAKAINVAAINQRLADAVRFYREWRKLWDMPDSKVPLAIPHLDQMRKAMQSMVEKLGDALHMAQDRGAHWEGFAGRGHNDPRTLPREVSYREGYVYAKTGMATLVCVPGTWDPDNPNDNSDGYKNAQRYTEEVIQSFKKMVSSDKLLFL